MYTPPDATVGLLVEVANVLDEGIRPPFEWGGAAACNRADDPDLFYPERGGTPARARAFCDGCAVKAECLA